MPRTPTESESQTAQLAVALGRGLPPSGRLAIAVTLLGTCDPARGVTFESATEGVRELIQRVLADALEINRLLSISQGGGRESPN